MDVGPYLLPRHDDKPPAWRPGRVVSKEEIPEPVPFKTQFRLLALVILTAIGPPILAVLWFVFHSIAGIVGYLGFVAFFWFVHWMLRKSQAMHPRTRGYPNYSEPI